MILRCASRRRRRVAGLLVGALLALASLLAPAEFPGQVDDLVGTSKALAQAIGVVPGVPDPCPGSPAGWEVTLDDAQICQISVVACPFSPYDLSDSPTRLMLTSADYPDFCYEDPVTAAGNQDDHAVCVGLEDYVIANGLEPYVVQQDADRCSVFQLRTCTVGTRIDPQLCVAKARRSWRCEAGIPRNSFNTCYVAALSPPAPDAVCALGAPEFVTVDCAHYVGSDFVASHDDMACAGYYTVDGSDMAEATNPYWCVYDASNLHAVCHSATPPAAQCGQHDALCLKRLSDTGGCRGVARAVLCLSVQAGYRSEAEALSSVPARSELKALADVAADGRSQGCEPCLTLPFEPIPDHCPDEYTETPVYSTGARSGSAQIPESAMRALEHEHDIQSAWDVCQVDQFDSEACRNLEPRCGTPSEGNVLWSSTHFSGVAVVNSAVIVTLRNVPTSYRLGFLRGRFRILDDTLDNDDDSAWNYLVTQSYATYPTAPDSLIRTYKRQPNLQNARTDEIFRHGNMADECVVEGLPVFRLAVEELWPDDGPAYGIDADGRCVVAPGDDMPNSDAAAIRRLFGQNSLDWWCRLSEDERRNRTSARGLDFLPDLTPDEQAEELHDRADSLAARVDCNTEQDSEVWCAWTPVNVGYFRLKVGGGWQMAAKQVRGWQTLSDLDAIRTKLSGFTDDDRARLRHVLGQLGCGRWNPHEDSCRWTPRMIGLNDAMTDILATGPGGDWRERDQLWPYQIPGDSHRFGGSDVRMNYTDGPTVGKYTETQEFGVAVNEVRVTTAQSNG